jgi:hypothetical protein
MAQLHRDNNFAKVLIGTHACKSIGKFIKAVATVDWQREFARLDVTS